MEQPEWVQETLSTQLRLNRQTWEALREHGVDEDSVLTLEFFYAAPSEESGRELKGFLADESGYQTEVVSHKDGIFSKRRWMVVGSTRQPQLSLELLDEWVTWMVLAGAEHGECDFDGWGAQVD